MSCVPFPVLILFFIFLLGQSNDEYDYMVSPLISLSKLPYLAVVLGISDTLRILEPCFVTLIFNFATLEDIMP
jgi:hypothetical protein